MGERYLAGSRNGGPLRFGASDIFALEAIVEQDELLALPKSAGSVQIVVDGNPSSAAADELSAQALAALTS